MEQDREGSPSWLLLGAAGGGAPGQPGTDRGQTDRPEVSALETVQPQQELKASSHAHANTQTHTHRGNPILRTPFRGGGRRHFLACRGSHRDSTQVDTPHTPWTQTHSTHTHPAFQPYTGTDTPLRHTHTLTISPFASGMVTRPHHTCADSHDCLHPEPPSGFLNGIHLSTLPAGHHSYTNTQHTRSPLGAWSKVRPRLACQEDP